MRAFLKRWLVEKEDFWKLYFTVKQVLIQSDNSNDNIIILIFSTFIRFGP